MAVVPIHKDKYILKQSTRGVSVVFRKAFVNLAQKTGTMVCANMQWTRQVFSTPGAPVSQEKPLSSPVAAVTLTWAFSPWPRPVYRLHRAPGVLGSAGETEPEPRLLLVLKFSISSSFVFL